MTFVFKGTLEFPVGTRHLDAAFGGFGAATGEEEMINRGVTKSGQLFCQFDRGLIRTATIARCIGEC